jgi:hypothetical protein
VVLLARDERLLADHPRSFAGATGRARPLRLHKRQVLRVRYAFWMVRGDHCSSSQPKKPL